MTTPIPNVNTTTLTNLVPNLDIGDVADPALRLAAFQYIYTEMQTIITAYNAFVANGGIATANIADLAITTAKLALLSVTAAQIANGTITSAQIADGTIVNADISLSAAIDGSKLANLTITSAQIADGSIVNVDINAAASIDATKIGNGDVNNTELSYINSLSSNAQTQLNAKAPLTHVGAGGSSQHPDATTSQSGFISAADLIAFRALTPTGLGSYAVPVGQIFSLWSRYSQEQDPVTGEMVFYEI
jgi:hypothetical protein